MRQVWPWIRTIVSIPAGLIAINLFHMLALRIWPAAYGTLQSDNQRILVLVLVTFAGIAGAFVVGAIARHRLLLHMVLFGVIALAIDVMALANQFSPEPFWFKALVIALLPLQLWAGGILALRTWKVRPAI